MPRTSGCKGPRKLKPRWLGPFTVLERVSPVNYRLLLPPELGTMHNVFHAAVLKPWKDDGRQPVARPGPVLVDGEQEYLVEAILAHRLIDAKQPSKGCWYLVKWAGYPISDATWEPEDNLVQDVPDLLKAYQKEKTLFSSYPEAELPKLPKTRSTTRSRASKDEVKPRRSKRQKALQKGLCK